MSSRKYYFRVVSDTSYEAITCRKTVLTVGVLLLF